MAYSEIKIKVPRFCEESGFYTTKQRSRNMSRIRGRDTKEELLLRKSLWHKGYRYRVNYKKLIGKPDIVFEKYKTVVFIDGEFWHGHNWEERRKAIKSNRDFWIPKIERNMQRDAEVNQVLQELGYTLFRFWGHEIKREFDRCLEEVTAHLEFRKKE